MALEFDWCRCFGMSPEEQQAVDQNAQLAAARDALKAAAIAVNGAKANAYVATQVQGITPTDPNLSSSAVAAIVGGA